MGGTGKGLGRMRKRWDRWEGVKDAGVRMGEAGKELGNVREF